MGLRRYTPRWTSKCNAITVARHRDRQGTARFEECLLYLANVLNALLPQ
ncbi:hypothetical protein SAMN05444340_11598 [Citreimonas salinaria]|uniref:Transposase n=1 Tax=Citreimonas salinaria TaxID=321339 RepID=A0A1H3M3I9_9RHOB|nr:hypothetical protein SAMN05444340_11598 [Citreimonas salinaria]